jgi:hypothetical protein
MLLDSEKIMMTEKRVPLKKDEEAVRRTFLG